MDVTTLPADPIAPPFDPHARDRIEQVATALIDLCGRLEDKLDAALRRIDALEAAQDEAMQGEVRR